MNQLHDFAQLPADSQAKIEDVCEAFELSWQGKQPPSLETTVQKLEGGLRTVLLRELLQIERHYRSQTLGRWVTDEELVEAHIGLAEEITRELPLTQAGDTPNPSDTRIAPPASHAAPLAPPAAATDLFEQLPAPFGRYRILAPLGTGGMGSVYLAEDTKLERRVALKLPRLDAGPNSQLEARFYQEAKAAATLSHPHLCALYDVGEVQGVRFLSMEFIEGEPLSALLKSDALLPQDEIAGLVLKLATALQEAHDKGVVHRDMKPSNVMINHRGEPVITDFGLAQRNTQNDARLTRSGDIIGTPAYMSPEQVDGNLDRMGPATDIYSLGAIFYELLSGQPPFRGSAASVLGQIMTVDPPPVSEHRPAVDPALEAICHKMLAKRIEDRFASMQEVAEALSAWMDARGQADLPQPAEAPPARARGRVGFWPRAPRWWRFCAELCFWCGPPRRRFVSK